MADNEGLRTTGEAIVKCITPDVCKTPPSMAPVPYEIIGRFSDGIRYADTVCMTGLEVITTHSRLSKVYGDEAGIGGGLTSGVNVGYCKPITHSPTVRAQGNFIVFHSAEYWMNCNGPDGPGNTKGKVIYVENVDAVYIGPLGNIEGDTNPPAQPETKKEESWWETGLSWVHTGLDVVGLIPVLGEVADGANALIHTAEAGVYTALGDNAKAAENAGMAVLSAAAMWPAGGQAATATKFAIKAGKEVLEEGAERVVKEGVEEGFEKLAKEGTEEALEKEAKEEAAEQAAKKSDDGVKVSSKRKPNQPTEKKWKDKGGTIKDNPDGSRTYTNKDGVEVTYDKDGYPDFSPYRHPNVKDVDIEFSGDYGKDIKRANEAAGLKEKPEGYSWHHHQNGQTMQLIEYDVHKEFSHTGGMSTTR